MSQTENLLPLSFVRSLFEGCCLGCQKRVFEKIIHETTPWRQEEIKRKDATPTANPTPLDKLLTEIAARHNLTSEAVKERSNMAHCVAARREFSKKAREAGYSLPKIGMFLGRHHSTILHLLNT